MSFKSKFDSFEGPVVVQTKSPIAMCVSESEYDLGEGKACGTPQVAVVPQFNEKQEVVGQQPVQMQVFNGPADFQEDGVIINTVGPDNKTPVCIWIENSNIASITMIPQHVDAQAPAQESKIIT